MERRRFLQLAAASALAQGFRPAAGAAANPATQPMALGWVITPYGSPEWHFRKAHELGFPTCFLSLDQYIGSFTPSLAKQFRAWLAKYELVATTVEVVGPGPLVWTFTEGPSTIGLVPPKTRTARIDALRQASDFAHQVGITQVQTHCGFIPENPKDPLYAQTVEAIRMVATHCQSNGQEFLMETGQETPITLLRTLRDVNLRNVGIGLDIGNFVLYAKANPVDALDPLGPHVRNVHAKDGRWPTGPDQLGTEVMMGQGVVDFDTIFARLDRLGYTGAVSIERETTGAQQVEDVRQEKIFMERVLRKVRSEVRG